jgi:phosphate-selective porin OprO/OprP
VKLAKDRFLKMRIEPIFLLLLIIASFAESVCADVPSSGSTNSSLYWDRGIHWKSKKKNLTLKIGGKFALDTGNIESDDALSTAFPDLEGYHTDIRFGSVALSGRLYRFLEYRLEVDFANVQDVKDHWVRFKKIPYLGYLQMGHFKEPFSLEREGSFNQLTFMENSLPTQAMGAGRNLGMMLYNIVSNDRITWKVGGFFNTESFTNIGNPQDRINAANGYNITARVIGRPWHTTDGRQLLHVGLSYSHQFRDADPNDPDNRIRFSTRPETRLTDDRLVDTGRFFADGVDIINPEFALVAGPFSLQGEYFQAFVETEEDLEFIGYYLYGSYFITGEHRRYNAQKSIFRGIKPKHDFRPFQGQWGAWELAARISYLDLNDGPISGGEELNFTAGLNWSLHSNARVMFNYIRADLKDRENPFVDNGSADIVQMRFHVFF